MGQLTTHVLDTAHGKTAAGLCLSLFRIEGEARILLKSDTTNSDGRCDTALLDGDALIAGVYEIVFDVGDYFTAFGVTSDGSVDSPAFLDQVPVRFGVSDEDAHYHVPLLVAPFAYSTYRGS